MQRRNWRNLGILLSILIMALAPLVLDAYRMITIEGVVTVEEAIDFDKESFAVTMYPGETHVETVTMTNKSSATLVVRPVVTVSKSGLNADAPDTVEVPGNGTASMNVTVSARTDIELGNYRVEVGMDR